MLAWRTVAQVLAVWSVPTLVFAQDPEASRVGAFPVEVDGKIRKEARARLQQSVEDGLARTSLNVIGPDDMASAGGGKTCKDKDCFVSIAEKAGVEYLVTTTVVVAGREYELGVTLIDGETGDELAKVSDSCQLCGLEEAAELLADVASSVHSEVQQLEEVIAPHLVVHSAPAGADVYIDGELAGQTPLDVELEQGTHAVRVTSDGYMSEEREIALLPDVRQRLVFNLERDSSSTRILGWTGVAVGLAAVGAGSALLAIDSNPNRSRCTGEDVDAQGDCRFRYNTLGGGLALSIGGAAVLAAVGVTALVLSNKRRGSNEEKDREARFHPTLDGFAVRF